MNIEKLNESISEAERFIKKANELKAVLPLGEEDRHIYYNPVESGAVKRSSMDLTRSLAQLRKPY